MNETPIEIAAAPAKILVVDDVPLNVRLIKEMLKDDHYEVFGADSGAEALGTVDRVCPDVILLDVMMPGMDGYEVCEHLKTSPKWRDIPIIIITALNETSDYVRALHCGADDFMSKPFSQTILKARIKAYASLRRTNLELKRHETFRYDMLRMVAHDLNNLMGAVIGHVELLQSGDLPDKTRRRVDKVMQSAEEAARLLRNFMGLEKMDAGGIHLHLGDVNLYDLVHRYVSVREPMCSDRGLDISLNVPRDIECHADSELLGRVVQNLLDNAIRYAPDNSQVRITGRPCEFGMRLSFANSGDRIDPKSLEHIFDRFYQVKSRPEHSRGGTGLGLSFCRMAVELMHGTISACSPARDLDSGVEFIVELPAPDVGSEHPQITQPVRTTNSRECEPT